MKKYVALLIAMLAMTATVCAAAAEQGFDALVMISKLDFYAEPSYDSQVLDTLMRMEEFTVCAPYERSGDFVRAKVDGVEGWISKAGVTTVKEHIVLGDACVTYTSPRCIFVNGKAEEGDVLLLIEEYEDDEEGGFYVVLTDEGTGFISKKADAYILEVAEAYRWFGWKAKDIRGAVNVYSQPDPDSAQIGRVEAGEQLKVLEEHAGYLTVLYGERYGYVYKYDVY